MDIEEFIFSTIASLAANIITSIFQKSDLGFLKKKRIKSRIESALTNSVESLIPFLASEGILKEKQELLIETCKRELIPLVEKPDLLFKGSLDGNKIFKQTYPDGTLPREIREENLEMTYRLLFPRIAVILCKISEVLIDWERHAWAENYRRQDEIFLEIQKMSLKIDRMPWMTGKCIDLLLL